MKVAQKNSTDPNTVSVAPPPPSNIPNIEPFPPPDRQSDDCPVLLQCPDQIIPNTKVSRNSSPTPDT